MSANGPPMGSRFHITASISSAAERSAERASDAVARLASPRSTSTARRHAVMRSTPLRTEDEPAAGRGLNHVVGHLSAGFEQEVQPAAMHGNEHVGFQLLDLADHLLEVIGRGRTEMETTDDGVDLLDTRHFLRLPDRIDDADMAAGRDHHQALAADVEAG